MPLLSLTSLDERLDELRRLVVGLLADPPATKIELKRLLLRELEIEPKPEILQAFSAIEGFSDRTAREIALRSFVVHFATESSLAEALESRDLDLGRLRRCVGSVPFVLALQEDEKTKFAAAIGTVDRLEREAIRRLRDSIVSADDRLLAVGVVIPEIERLVLAVREGRSESIATLLDSDEIEEIALAAGETSEATRPDREIVDAIALRTLISREIGRWRALPGEDLVDGSPPTKRREIRETLESALIAHHVVSYRLDALRSRRFQETHATSRRLDHVRRRLFATFLELKKTLAGEPGEPIAEFREMIREAEDAAAVIDAEQEKTRALMRDAAAPDGGPRALVAEPPGMRAETRGRRRRKILTGIAVFLVPVAVGTNVFLGSWGGAPEGLTTDDFESALPLQEVVPLPGALYSQVSSLLWASMREDERMAKFEKVAEIARREGFSMVFLVDEDRREVARSSVVGGTELFVLAPLEPSAEAEP